MSEKAVPDPGAVGWQQDPENPDFWTWVTDELVEEAPDDGAQYGRESKTWTEIVMPEVPEIPDFVETDPTVPDHVKAISTDDTASWSAAYSWGDHREAGYATMMWVQSNYQIKGDYLTTADKLWTDISSETGNNTIERFGDEVWVTNFKTDEVYVGTKIGNGVETTGDLSAGGATFSGSVNASDTKMANRTIWADTAGGSSGIHFGGSVVLPALNGSPTKAGTIDFGGGDYKWNNAYFTGTVTSGTAQIGHHSVTGAGGASLINNTTNTGVILTNNGAALAPTESGARSIGSASLQFRDGFFSGSVNANKFVGDGSGLTGVDGGISATDVTALYEGGSAKKVYTYASGGRVTGNLLATSDVYAYYSDERLKTKTGEIENALDKVDAIDCFYYTHNDIAKSLGYEGEHQQVGVSAQSVKAVMPECVGRAPIDDDGEGGSVSGEDYMTVKYERLVPLLLQSVKELTARVKELEGDS